MGQPRILTFNFHEPYLCLMAKTGLRMDVGLYESGPMMRPWHTHFRSIPPELTLVPEREWRQKLKRGEYDVAVAHNEMNAMELIDSPCAKLMTCHNRRTFINTGVTTSHGDPLSEYQLMLEELSDAFSFVFISESKRADYGFAGDVIYPGIDVEAMGGYTGERVSVLRVGNMMRGRNLMFDVGFQNVVCERIPNRVVGLNPEVPDSVPADSYEDLLACYRGHRCMLHVSRGEYEDGYNLSMLEAMACGMPVVALANTTSPITNEVDGVISYDPVVIRNGLIRLLKDRDYALELGARGRETVADKFPIATFASKWRDAILGAADAKPAAKCTPKEKGRDRTNILLHYISSPLTTGRYFDEVARKDNDVLGLGFRLPEKVLELWGFSEPPPPYAAHPIDLPLGIAYESLIKELPQGYHGAVYIWIDSGQKELDEGLELLGVPKVAYLIDTPVSAEQYIKIGKQFDCCFLAQKGQIGLFREAGVENVYWLPLACAPGMHLVGELDRHYDVAYIGGLSPEEPVRRRDLIAEVGKRFENNRIGKCWPHEMAKVYAQSKIVINSCHNRDVNMRVFEAMASGALLITDEADGLEDIFQDGIHLVVYRNDEDACDMIAHYLEHAEDREKIAKAGQELVLREHTYAKRFDEMLEIVTQCCGPLVNKPLCTSTSTVTRPEEKSEAYYSNARRELFPFIPLKAKRHLDLGCGTGATGKILKEERNVEEVVGIEIIEEAYEKAKKNLDRVILGNIETMDLPFEDDYFDSITCGDVLEHLIDPVGVLKKLSRVIDPEGAIVISMPNIRYYEIVAMLSVGAWTYMDQGLMDSTHLRFYTRESIVAMIEDAGLEVASIQPLSMCDKELIPRNNDGSLTMGKVTIRDCDEAEYEEFRVYQYLAVACRPGFDRLSNARHALTVNENEAAFSYAIDAVGVDETEQRLIMAKALVRLGDLTRGEEIYHFLIKNDKTPSIQGEYGILLVGMNRGQEAKAHLEEALAADPKLHRVRGTLGMVLATEERFEEAFEHLKEALAASYEYVALIQHFINVGRALNELDATEQVVHRFSEFYPGDSDLACDHAELLDELGRREEALEGLESLLLLFPKNMRATELIQKFSPNAT